MVLKSVIFVILIIALQKIEVTSSQQVVCIDYTRSLELGEPAVISCEYPVNFIAVFWYRGQEENPFLRLEGGRTTTTESGFSIDSSGSMTIENVQIDHEGTYRTSVLDTKGKPTSATVNIYVKVSLTSDPHLESCSTSQHELCQGFNEEEKTTILICYTTETRPAVNLTWSKLSSNGFVDVVELRSISSVNSSTGLFISSSLFRYDINEFSLQYFTCAASGQEVTDERDTAIFVEGNEDVPKPLMHDEIIYQGKALKIRCSSSFQLAKWTFTYPNDTVRLIKEVYPEEEGGSCSFGSKCYVNENGVLSIETTTYEHEGSYTCTYGNGENTRMTITQVSVVVKPNPEHIDIKGCTNITYCNKNVALTGTLQASITGARPYVELKCEITEEAESPGFIFGDKNSKITHPESGTFDTVYTAEYKIDKCSEPVPVICKIQGDTIFKKLPSSHVTLVTDLSSCKNGKPGLAVFLVIVFLLIAGTIIFFILYKRRRAWVQQHLLICLRPEPDDVTEGGRKITQDDLEQREQKLDEDRGEGEGANVEKETKTVEKSSQPLIPNELLSTFDKFCKELKQIQRVPIKQFESLMTMFQEHDQTKPPGSSLVNQMVEENCENEMLSIVLNYLADLTPNSWVPILDFCKLLEELTSSNTLSPGTSLTNFVALLKSKKINLSTYVDETGKLLKRGKFDEITLMTNLKDLLSKGLINQEDLVDSILKYMITFQLNKKTAMEEAKNLERQVPYPLFLRGINTFYKSGSCEDILFHFFDDIVRELSSSQSARVIQQRVSDENEAISCVYLQVLLCSIVDGKMLLERAISMLQSGIRNEEVLLSEYEKAYETSMKNEKITDELQRKLTRTFLRLLKEVASADYFEEESLKMINSKQLNNMFWIRFIVDLWKEGAVNEELKSKLILKVADAYVMPRKDFKKPLDEMIGYDDRKQFLAPIQFNEGKKKIKEKKK